MSAVSLKTAVARAVYALVASTSRLAVVEGGETIERLRAEEGAALVCFWHSRILGCTRYCQLELVRRGVPVRVMVSRSEDGEIISRIIESWGAQTARGSTSRGGSAALRRLTRFLGEPPAVAITTPDGPRGPARRVQPGTVLAAELAGVPIVPMSYAASPAWRLSSWDRFVVPRPFSRLAVVIEPPLAIERRGGAAAREAVRERLERSLRRADRRAAERLASAG
ncbi:MAG: lysophospholipid acyltransferase family protein [Thermoanaerobaculia bacterium]|nr:lysophospholipid acyltransferase family protein [Thermoanaerobaculia bacterium]